MITLIIARHAKSDWGDEILSDHDRTLNDRGRRDAPAMAAALAATGVRPEMILSSSAVRARTTAEFFAAALEAPLTVQRELYGASAPQLWSAAAQSGAKSLMIVAHDPGMSVLAEALSRGRITHMPTCAVATFTWDEDDWEVVDAIDPIDWTWETPRG